MSNVHNEGTRIENHILNQSILEIRTGYRRVKAM
jgi:hypothetical protein